MINPKNELPENKILMIVDDDKDDRFFFCSAVKKYNPTYICLEAENGVDALQQIRSGDKLPDFIFTLSPGRPTLRTILSFGLSGFDTGDSYIPTSYRRRSLGLNSARCTWTTASIGNVGCIAAVVTKIVRDFSD